MKSIFLLVCLILGSNAVAQITKREKWRVLEMIGGYVVELPTEKTYRNNFECSPCQLDTSLVMIGKSDGGYFKNEFVLYHNSISFKEKSEVFKAIRKTYVTINEYQEFEDWVRDSIARMKLVEGIDQRERSDKYAEFEWVSKYRNDSTYTFKSLKWKQRFSYYDPDLMPYLADMYLPQPQRFYKQRIFDKRKYYYKYVDEYELLKGVEYDSIQFYVKDADGVSSRFDEINYHVSIFRDEFLLGKQSRFVRDERSTFLHFRKTLFADFPVNGLRGFQAEAFCHWKAREIQEKLSKKGLNYSVRVTLPLIKDVEAAHQNQLDEINVQQKDYTDHWRISNKEYVEFLNFVKDSVLREYVYANLNSDEKAIQLLDYNKEYFDEGSLEMASLDISDRRLNRWYFNLNKEHSLKLKALKDAHIFSLYNSLNDDQLYSFKYFDMNFEKRAEVGEYEPDEYWRRRKPPIEWTIKRTYPDCEPFGKDLVLGYNMNQLGEAKCTRSHANIQRFFEPNNVDVRPTNYGSVDPNDSTITTISYEQALAFYHWKFPIDKIYEKSNWQDYVLPTKEEYEQIVKGQSVIVKEHSIKHEGPFFRYVIHLFPEN